MKSKDFSTNHKNNHDDYQRGYGTVQFRLVLLCSIILSFSIIPMTKTCSADAVGTVYIRADGSIEGTTYIQTVDNITYVFTANINDSIVVERNNIIIEGNGHTLQGAGSGRGIELLERTNVTVHNATIKAFHDGIVLDYSSSSNVLSGNNITNNSGGIALACSSNNTVSGNNITTNDVGIVLTCSSNNTLAGNIMTNNLQNFAVWGTAFSDFVNYVDTSNMVDGKPVYYWINKCNMTVPSVAGTVVLANCTRITVPNLNLTHNGQGILLAYTTNSTITQNNIANFILFGIRLDYSSNNTVSGNNITTHLNGVYGIFLYSSSNNTVSGNNITTNDVGIVLDYSSNNVIYHNNFVDNHEQVSSNTSMNVWDDGYPSGGNYWSDYNGTDANHDGIGDTPYVIDANNTDHYPLMVQYVIPEFPSFLVLPLFMVATLLAIVIYKRRHLTRA
jgi:parallel beta-helix repeat protein